MSADSDRSVSRSVSLPLKTPDEIEDLVRRVMGDPDSSYADIAWADSIMSLVDSHRALRSERDGMRATLGLAADTLSWALDLIDTYDEELIRRGDPVELVNSPVQVRAKATARQAIDAIRPRSLSPDTDHE